MAAIPESGFLVIADLTGYTAYLSRSEIEHAPVIAGDLLETIVGRLEPPFRLAKFEGDAAFLFVEDGRAEASLLMDAIEAAYIAFRRRLRSIEGATTCDCNSCRLAPKLDLKLFIHHGEFVYGPIAGRDELAGSDVIVVHRLLKGTGAAEARANGFALFTAAAVAALGLDPDALGLRLGPESIEYLGRIETFTLDLEARWQAESGERRLDITDEETTFAIETDLAAEPSVVWAHLTSPALRTRWEGPLLIDGIVREWASRGRDHGPVRDRPAGHARGDRRLATVRPRRLAAGRARSRSGHRDRRPERRERRHSCAAPLGRPGRFVGGPRRDRADAYRQGGSARPPGVRDRRRADRLTFEPLQGLLPA